MLSQRGFVLRTPSNRWPLTQEVLGGVIQIYLVKALMATCLSKIHSLASIPARAIGPTTSLILLIATLAILAFSRLLEFTNLLPALGLFLFVFLPAWNILPPDVLLSEWTPLILPFKLGPLILLDGVEFCSFTS